MYNLFKQINRTKNTSETSIFYDDWIKSSSTCVGRRKRLGVWIAQCPYPRQVNVESLCFRQRERCAYGGCVSTGLAPISCVS